MLRTNRVKLSPLGDDDAEILFNWINDRELVLFNSRYRPVHSWQHREWFESVRSRDDVVIFGIRLATDDRLIGTCQVVAIDPHHGTGELQIRIADPAERGQGHGTEAVRLLLSHAFRDLRLRRVELSVFVGNAAARRCYERAGFKEEGVLRQAAWIDGHPVDVVVMGILAHEFDG